VNELSGQDYKVGLMLSMAPRVRFHIVEPPAQVELLDLLLLAVS
jgi:hypothetical protein